MKQRFFICKHCGNLIAMVKDTGVPVVCKKSRINYNKLVKLYERTK